MGGKSRQMNGQAGGNTQFMANFALEKLKNKSY
jgi:hypothetical protein